MKRLTCFMIMLALSMVMSSAMAQLAPEPEFKAGIHYQVINPAQPTNDPSKIEVVEVFSYGCTHCNNFQPYVEPWSKNLAEDISYRRQPVVFGRQQWAALARAYYTIDALDMVDEVHNEIFKAIHIERNNLTTDGALADFVAGFGVDKDEYIKTASSFAIETKLKRGITLTKNYGVRGTPSVIVNGKYLTTPTMATTIQKSLDVTDYLIELERAEMKKSGGATDTGE